MAAKAGALSVDSSDEYAEKAYTFGEMIGIAFQIKDDILSEDEEIIIAEEEILPEEVVAPVEEVAELPTVETVEEVAEIVTEEEIISPEVLATETLEEEPELALLDDYVEAERKGDLVANF